MDLVIRHYDPSRRPKQYAARLDMQWTPQVRRETEDLKRQGCSIKQIQQHLEETHQFRPSYKQLRLKIGSWASEKPTAGCASGVLLQNKSNSPKTTANVTHEAEGPALQRFDNVQSKNHTTGKMMEIRDAPVRLTKRRVDSPGPIGQTTHETSNHALQQSYPHRGRDDLTGNRVERSKKAKTRVPTTGRYSQPFSVPCARWEEETTPALIGHCIQRLLSWLQASQVIVITGSLTININGDLIYSSNCIGDRPRTRSRSESRRYRRHRQRKHIT